MSEQSGRDEYITIIANSAAEAMAQFKAQDLGGLGYTIFGRMGRHQVTLVGDGGPSELCSGEGMIAATFARRVAR